MERRSRFTYRQLSQLQKYSVDTPLRVIAHIDLDAFYAQVEVKRLNLPPSEPLAVQQWQSLIAVNYAARAHGVTRHETAADALKRCPTLKLVHVATWRSGDVHWSYRDSPSISTHKACLDPYRIESKKILAVFRSACPRVEKASIDESFLDLSAMVHEALLERYPELTLPPPYGDPSEMLPLPQPPGELEWAGSCVLDKEEEKQQQQQQEGEGGVLDWDDVVMAVAAEIVQRVRERVRVEVGYTCSAGIAGNKMLAKLGSGYKKPNSQTVVRPGAIQKFLNTLEFTKIRNLGGKLGSQISAAFNTSSLSALIEIPLPQLHAKLPAEDATWLYNTIRGIDKSDVNPRTAMKSMLSAKSFRPPITGPEQALKWLRVFVADLHSRLVDEEGVQEGKRRPTSITMMHRGTKPGSQKTRQAAMTAKIELGAMLAQAESLLKGVVAEGGAYPCAGLSLQVGGFEEKESGNRGIAGFLVKRQPGEPSVVAVERESKRRRVEEGIGRYIRKVDKEDDLDRDLEEELSQQSPPPIEDESPQNDPPPPLSPSPPPPTPPPQETHTYACTQCNSSIPLEGREEHEDWHFAKSLVEQDKAAARERIAAARTGKAEPTAPAPAPAPAPAKSSKKGPKKGGGKKGGGGLEKGQSKLAFGKS